MLMTLKTEKAMPADLKTVWAEITQADFVKQFLPEIKTNQDRILPAYVVKGSVLSWSNNRSTDIRLVNKDLDVNITSIELSLTRKGENTLLTFEVEFETKINRKFIHALRAIRALFHKKLAVLKQDLEHNQINHNLAYA